MNLDETEQEVQEVVKEPEQPQETLKDASEIEAQQSDVKPPVNNPHNQQSSNIKIHRNLVKISFVKIVQPSMDF